MMRVTRLAIVLLRAAGLVGVGGAGGRVALAVGNSSYAHIGRLPNPETDAVDLAAALRRARVRGDDDEAGHGSCGADGGVVGVHATERGGGRGGDGGRARGRGRGGRRDVHRGR
ncbi:MAG: hypothetical protein OXH52_12270 [Gammaproteobacteria bacterium]|nr:hypothetical protein [Gammaproteobacteria bacterium]